MLAANKLSRYRRFLLSKTARFIALIYLFAAALAVGVYVTRFGLGIAASSPEGIVSAIPYLVGLFFFSSFVFQLPGYLLLAFRFLVRANARKKSTLQAN